MQTFGNKKTQIIFFGSGPVAKESLALLAKDFDIEAVITKSSTLDDMQNLNLSTQPGLYAVNNKSELDNLFNTQNFKSKLAVLIDFGIIVSQKVIDYFKFGIINSHFSILPQWRGADPITFAILSGQKQTGVSSMLLVEAMDEGPLLAQATYDIPNNITATKLTEDLIELSHKSLQTILPMYLNDEIQLSEQSNVSLKTDQGISYSRKLTKQDGVLDFNKPAIQLEREVRAYIEWPKSRTKILGQDVIITEAKVLPQTSKPAQITTKDKRIIIGCQKDSLEIIKLKPSGKNIMATQAFLLGYLKK